MSQSPPPPPHERPSRRLLRRQEQPAATSSRLPAVQHWLHAHGLSLALVLAAILVFGGFLLPRWYLRHHEGRVLPGVRVAGVDLGGLDAAAARSALVEALPVYQGRVELFDEGDPLNLADQRTWERATADLGLTLDPGLAVDLAMSAGRDPDLGFLSRGLQPLRLRWRGLDLLAPIAVDEERARATLEALAPEMAVPPRDARIERRGTKVLTLPAAPGRALDLEATLEALRTFAARPVGAQVPLVFAPTGAAVSDVEGVAQAERVLFDGPVELVDRAGGSFSVATDTLKTWFSIETLPNEAGFDAPAVVVDRDAILAWLAELAPGLVRPVQEPRYDLAPATGLFTLKAEGQSGTELDLEASLERVIEAAYSEQGRGELALRLTPTVAGDDLASQLNRQVFEVRRMAVGFGGAPPELVANLLAGIGRLSGSLVMPGQEFSFLGALGPVSEEAGFDPRALPPAQALAQGSGLPASGWAPDGALMGGIELLSSLSFRLVFWLGLPITERRAPPWRVGWLEPPVGMDAAVGRGAAGEAFDLRFVNDSALPLVLSFSLDSEKQLLLATAYGSRAAFETVDPGYAPEAAGADEDEAEGSALVEDPSSVDDAPPRTVSLRGPVVRDLLPAASALALRDDRLPLGATLQVSWAREGATVLVERQVTVGDQPRTPDVFLSSYLPARDLRLAGTGRP